MSLDRVGSALAVYDSVRAERSRGWAALRLGATIVVALVALAPPVVGAQTITAAWDPSPPSDNVTGYQVCIGTSSMSCNIQLASVPASQTSHVFAPQGGVLHYVAVRAVNATGASPYSTEASFSIPGFTQPLNQSSPAGTAITPLNLSVTDPDGSSLTFVHTGLPLGLSINQATGQITGTPSAAGTYSVTVFVNDGLATVSRTFNWTITTGASADTVAPALVISSHTPGQMVATTSVTISGTASDSGLGGSGISGVTVNGQNASGGAATGNNAANWSRALTLSPGANTITVQATDGAGNMNMQQFTLNVNTTIPPVTSVSLTASAPSPQDTGVSIVFTANGSGGVAPQQYKFLVQQGAGSPQIVRNWSTTATYTWTPTTAASYTVSVWARSAGVTTEGPQAQAQTAFTIDAPAVTGVALASNVPSPQDAGTPVILTASATRGVGPTEYKFLVQQGSGSQQVAQNWSTSATYTWTPTVAANYTITVWARSAGVTLNAPQAQSQIAFVASAPLTITSLASNPPSPRELGTTITFTASASGGTGPYSYKWWIYDGTAWAMVRDWSTMATFTWVPTAAGSSYRVGIWARSATSTANSNAVNLSVPFTVTVPATAEPATPTPPATTTPVSVTGLASNLPSPQTTGTSITFTAAATGGTAPYSYKWWLFDGATWIMVRDWSTSATYSWTPTAAGINYRVGVWVRDSLTTANTGAANLSVPFVVTATAPSAPAPTPTPNPNPVTVTGIASNFPSPKAAGTSITFTATATGGTAPYSYKWWVYDGTNWTMVRDWSTTATFTWTPTIANSNYRIGIWARDATSTSNSGAVNLSVPYSVLPTTAPPPASSAAPLVATGITASMSPVQGVPVTFTATASGGVSPYQFKWWVLSGTTWTMVRDWGAASFTWTPPAAGTYRVGAWVRDSITAGDAGTVNLSIPVGVASR